jgi:hypothetical protein
LGIEDLNARISLEVRRIESQQMSQSMPLHGCNQARVVSAFTDDLIGCDYLLPQLEYASLVPQDRKHEPKSVYVCGDDLGFKSKPVLFNRTGGDGPILVEYLRYDSKFVSLAPQRLERSVGNLRVRMVPMGDTRQDIGINQHSHAPRPSYMLSRESFRAAAELGVCVSSHALNSAARAAVDSELAGMAASLSSMASSTSASRL